MNTSKVVSHLTCLFDLTHYLTILYLTLIFKSIAEKQFQETQNSDYLRFIEARASQMLRDNKVLSEKGKKELERLLSIVKTHLAWQRQNNHNFWLYEISFSSFSY